MENLINKIQKLNTVFNESASTLIPINALLDKLCKIIGSNIYLFDTEGIIFAYSIVPKFLCPYTKCSLENGELPEYYFELFKDNDKSIINKYQSHPTCTYKDIKDCMFRDRYYSIYPIYSNFKKLAGILFIKYDSPFSESDEILCEYVVAIVSIEMLRREQEKTQHISTEIAKAKIAVNSLTSNEIKAVEAILFEIKGNDGEVFLNSIASKTFTTPSTVSSALKKLELATLISSKTMGVKGKYIKILNNNLRIELDQIKDNI